MASGLLERYTDFVLRFRWLVIVLATLLMIVLAAGGRTIEVENNYRALFNEDNPRLVAFDAFEQTYSASNSVLIAISPPTGSVFDREVLEAVHGLTESAWTTPYSSRGRFSHQLHAHPRR